MRKLVRGSLATLPFESVTAQSGQISELLLNTDVYRHSQSVGIFLPLIKKTLGNYSREVQTVDIIAHALKNEKKVFVPRVVGSGTMVFLPVHRVEDIDGYEVSSFGIPEPPLPIASAAQKGKDQGADLDWYVHPPLDLLVVPGVAFTRGTMSRVGQGAGFYDRYLARHGLLGSGHTTLMGVCLQEQIVEDGSFMEDAHDARMDMVIDPSGVHARKGDCATEVSDGTQ